MTDCCTPKGYRWVFSERSARAEAKRYRRKGLDATSRRISDFVNKQGVEGRTVLEVGGGIGAIQLELVRAGATRREFHIFLHPPSGILATSEQHGLRTVHNQSGVVWTVAALCR